MDWRDLVPLLRHPDCQGTGAIQLIAEDPFYDEDLLPFELLGGALVLHILPDPGFPKESLAATEDERLLIVDCPDDDGWLVPEALVSEWLDRNVDRPDLEDLLLAHPLYEYLTALDEHGHSRGGHRGDLVRWAPGEPHIASLYAPEFLPNDPDAPRVNRDRDDYADAVQDLLTELEAAFDLVEVEVPLRFGAEPFGVDDGDDDDGDDDPPRSDDTAPTEPAA